MNIILYILLIGCAVKCDDTSYYVVQMPDRTPTKEFKVYWNVPTKQCTSKKIPFENLYEKYGIIQNTGDTFTGDQITILYDPGEFPALLKNTSSGELFFRNGGVPQEGDLITHLNRYKQNLEDSIPDKDFNGIGIIDFESWRPIFRQNFGNLVPYKTVSIDIERKKHWFWPKDWIEAEATRRFEESGREFMQATIALSKRLRPQAVWGYYGFPYCFNIATNNRKESCADKVPEENSRMTWLWSESTALYPSVYSSKDTSTDDLVKLIRGRVREAVRVRRNGVPVLPYFWYKYRDGGFFKQADLTAALNTFAKSDASGMLIWGSSSDVNTVDKCKTLLEYTTNILGPTVAKYTKPTKLSDEIENNDNQSNDINDGSEPINEDNILVHLILGELSNIWAKKNDSKENDKIRLTTENPFGKNVTSLDTDQNLPFEFADFLPTSTAKNETEYSYEEKSTTTQNINTNDFETSTYLNTTDKSTINDINDYTSDIYGETIDIDFSTIKTTNNIVIDSETDSTTESSIENLDTTISFKTSIQDSDFNQFSTYKDVTTDKYETSDENTEKSSTSSENTTKSILTTETYDGNEENIEIDDQNDLEFINKNLDTISTTSPELNDATTEYDSLKSTIENESYEKSTVLNETESTKSKESENQVVVF